MNCHFVQSQISAFIDRELDAEEKRELRKHLISCSDCSVEYQDLLRLKGCLENLVQEPCSFDAVVLLRERLVAEPVFLPRTEAIVWAGRVGLVAAGLLLFFLSTAALFPTAQNTTDLAERRNSFTTTPVAFDQNIAIDHPVNIYQASSILP